tara:strand:+ start:260 stop:448 length:189 start_codon:yes stop_codon:yes gene_type:complete
MQVITRILQEHLDAHAPVETTKAVSSYLADELKIKVDSFKLFAEAPFKAEVVVYETPEDYLE